MTELDPFTYEILRHRMLTIALEGATALQHVSGSPLATEAFDMNTSIMSAGGEVAFVGPYLLTGPMGQGLITKGILRDAPTGEQIEPGDVYLCNDPYSGSAHQNCVTLVAPIHVDGRLIAWSGATLHVVDVGGKSVGQIGIGAQSILDEAPTIPPTKLVRRGVVDAAIEAGYLSQSRTPELNALDLRAKLAAVNTIRRRLGEVSAEYGAEAVAAAIAQTIDRGAAHLRARLRELPDASVSHSAFVDQEEDGEIRFYEVRLRVEKQGDRIVFDFRGSSKQAGAVVNCTRSGLLSGVLVAVLTTLVWDAPWCPAAIDRTIEVRSDPGTVVDAAWPGGCSMATMAAGFAATTASAVAIGKLLAGSAAHHRRAMAAWAGAVGSIDVFGQDASGQRFGTVLLDSMAAGTGATAERDGIDCGGFLRSIGCVVPNVEQYEQRFPLLYLWRRHEPDSGGPGRNRGGTGVGFAVVPHGVPSIETVSPHFSGTAEPESAGLVGGYPGSRNRVFLVSDSGVAEALADGSIPQSVSDLGSHAVELPGVARLRLGADDLIEVRTSGGGGWGDPLEREPGSVAADVAALRITGAAAAEAYGVVLRADWLVDQAATSQRRSALRSVRIARATGDVHWPERPVAPGADGVDVIPTHAGHRVRCRLCGWESATSGTTAPIDGLPFATAPIDGGASFGLIERSCPACHRLLAVERVSLTGGT